MSKKIHACVDREIEEFLSDKPAGYRFSAAEISQRIESYWGVNPLVVASRLRLRYDCRSMHAESRHCFKLQGLWEYTGAGE